ncbi:MAG: uracil-DNA glycosylase [Clostridia bacterium]|nr:uracil-DNA glycosylase [Clostridia bacterium]
MEVNMNYFKNIIENEAKKEYYIKLHNFIEQEYHTQTIYPERNNVYSAFKYTPYNNVKVVILGQDPYHGEGEAHGLSFSVQPGVKIPPSLKNIYKELNAELGCYIPNNGYLVKWAEQGVLLLNSVLTVQKDTPASHRGKGWETFTDKVIEEIDKKDEPVVFMLWGNFAKSKRELLQNPKHLVLESAHPSPFSARNGFFGNNHFVKANEYLEANGVGAIDWQIENI